MAEAGRTIEEKREWLGRYRLNLLEIERLKDEIARWRSLAEYGGGSLVLEGMGTGSMADAVERMILLEEELAVQLDKRVRRRRAMERTVNTVANEGQRVLLRLRYIDGMGFERIAETMGYCLRQVTRLHQKALEAVELPGGGG